jgi:7-cyano-7-deazaguanine synthase
MNKAMLISGGMDSIALAYWKRPTYGITVDYGQLPAEGEIQSSKIICELLHIEHIVIKVDCSALGSGDLSQTPSLNISPSQEWWPYRNQLLVTLACMRLAGLGVEELFTGSVKQDGFHRDGTPAFYTLINDLAEYQEGNLKVSAPAIGLNSVELIMKSGITSDLLLYAHSCHTGSSPCGYCRGCNKYMQTLQTLTNAGWT